MKDNSHILTLQETETLCRLYLECQLSVLEEKELQYLLSNLEYTSPVIEEALESMLAEGILSERIDKRVKKRRKFRWIRQISGIAASLIVLFALSIFVGNQIGDAGGGMAANHSLAGSEKKSDELFIAYEGGKRLSPEDSEKAVNESLKKAEALMAMAAAKEREDELKQEYFIHLISEEK